MYIYEKFNAPKAAAPQMLFTAIPHRPTSYASLLAMGECNAGCPLCQWTHGHTRTTQDALSSPQHGGMKGRWVGENCIPNSL